MALIDLCNLGSKVQVNSGENDEDVFDISNCIKNTDQQLNLALPSLGNVWFYFLHLLFN